MSAKTAHSRFAYLTAATVLVADQATKAAAVATLEGKPARHLIGSVLQLSLVRNPGAAFSVGTGMTIVFTAFAGVISVVIVRTARRLTHRGYALALGAMLGGALGNLIDRLFRWPGALRGHVVDFIELPNFPLFNVADSAIVCAAILIGVLSLRGVEMTR